MRYMCEIHGQTDGLQSSPDLLEFLGRMDCVEHFEISYVYDGAKLVAVFVSEDFARERGITERGVVDLPDHLPKWHDEAEIVCAKSLFPEDS